jgi:hypothetical protein
MGAPAASIILSSRRPPPIPLRSSCSKLRSSIVISLLWSLQIEQIPFCRNTIISVRSLYSASPAALLWQTSLPSLNTFTASEFGAGFRFLERNVLRFANDFSLLVVFSGRVLLFNGLRFNGFWFRFNGDLAIGFVLRFR